VQTFLMCSARSGAQHSLDALDDSAYSIAVLKTPAADIVAYVRTAAFIDVPLLTDTRGMSRTWDGKPIADDPPFGATVIVYRVLPSGTEFLLLHRAHAAPDHLGNWVWTPPAGARHPGESIEACAQRELREETGLTAPLRRLNNADGDWAIFLAQPTYAPEIVLDDEHDRFEWVSLRDAMTRCRPEHAATGFALARCVISR
jgi:8-oxo-dGTP pyrophosphatase MutT (NUDIX family)